MSMITDICRMRILLISATDFEIKETIEFLKAHQDIEGPEIDTLCSGVGILSTTHALTRRIIEKRPELIIQAGIGGGSELNMIGKTFAITSEKVADLGVTENSRFKSVFDLNLAEKDRIPFENGWLVNPAENLIRQSGLDQAKGITVNEITTEKQKLLHYKQNAGGPVVESMEGAALHYVCLQEKIPFLQIRAVSNEMGERDKAKWKLVESLRSLNEELIELLQKIDAGHENDFRL